MVDDYEDISHLSNEDLHELELAARQHLTRVGRSHTQQNINHLIAELIRRNTIADEHGLEDERQLEEFLQRENTDAESREQARLHQQAIMRSVALRRNDQIPGRPTREPNPTQTRGNSPPRRGHEDERQLEEFLQRENTDAESREQARLHQQAIMRSVALRRNDQDPGRPTREPNPTQTRGNSPPRRGHDWLISAKDKLTYIYYFFVTLIIHIAYVLLTRNDSIDSGMFILWYSIIFTFITGFYCFWHWSHPEEVRSALIATVLGLLVYLIPFLAEGRVSLDIENTISFLVLYIPVWPVLMLSRLESVSEGGFFHFIFSLWKVGLLIVALASAAILMRDLGTPGFARVDLGSPGDILGGAWAFIKDIWVSLTSLTGSLFGIWERAADPQTYYRGRVEEGQEVPLGVEFTDIRAADSMVSNDTPVTVYSTIRARPTRSQEYLGEEVRVEPSCVIDDNDGAVAASVDPVVMPLVWGTFGQFECNFPPLGRRGSYTIEALASFPFQTWAYLEYTFVDDELVRSYARQGLDISDELDIDQNPSATYTNGPVVLGMGGTPQPIRVDPEGSSILPEGVRLGITLDSNWRNGQIGTVDRLEIRVPDPFRLDQCDRELAGTDGKRDENNPLYTIYTFQNPKVDGVTGFTSVTCKLVLDDESEARSLLSSETNTMSFVGAAYYKYTIDDKTTVQVR